MRYSSQADLVQVRTWATGIAGATADGAGASPPWMTTSSPSLTSEFVRPRPERVTRSRIVSLGFGAVDEPGASETSVPERSGWSWDVRMGADAPIAAPERSGWSWRARMGAGSSGDSRLWERAGWSRRGRVSRPRGDGRPSGSHGASGLSAIRRARSLRAPRA